MKRFLAFVGLLFICVGPVTADYLFIKIDLNKINNASEGETQPGAQPGGLQPGIGPGGAQPGFGAGGKKGGKGGIGVGPGPGGLAAQPPMGALGGGPMGAVGPGGIGNAADETPPHWIMAYIELRSKPDRLQQPQTGLFVTEVNHKFGVKGRFPDAKGIVVYDHISHDSITKEFNKSYGKYVTEGKDAAALYRAASWALSHGLTKEFHNAMSVLAKVDAKHFAVVNYTRVQSELKNAPGADDPATQGVISSLKDEDFKLTTSDAGHYGLLAKSPSALTAAIIKRRLVRFEEAYDNFFYWFALQENVTQPPMPKYRLYAVMMDDKQKFHEFHANWSKQPMVADSFTPRRDNLIFLSTKRLDENYIVFEKNVTDIVGVSRLSRDELISGRVWDKAENKANMLKVSAVQTLAIMQKAMEDEAERAAISHEATRQLLFSTGILPRLVNVPEWVQSGLASYFDTPHGALYTGIGLPSWSNLVTFRHYRKIKDRLGKSPYEAYEAFLRTISNQYFQEAQRIEEDHKDLSERDATDKKLKEEREIAQSTAWALMYYLLTMEKKLPEVLQYTQELSRLPRDMELDERTLQLCFGRAFGLIDPADPRRLHEGKTKAFASSWFNRMLEVNLEVPKAQELLAEYRYPPEAKKKTATNQPGGGIGGPLLGPGANPNVGPGANPNALPLGNLKGG